MRRYTEFYAAGAFQRATGVERMQVISPSTSEQVAEVVTCSENDLTIAIQSARKGFEAWSTTSHEERKGALQRLHAELALRVDEAAENLADEMGCPVWLGKLMQLPMALKGLEFAIDGIAHVQWIERVGNGLVERVPSGVIAAITPWNFPFHQIVAKVAPAIAAGCTVILKPSEVSPGAARLFIEAVHATGLPPGVVNLVWGGADIGRALVKHPAVDRISFTGSTNVGRRIMATAAEGLKPVTLELGGKSAAVILDDADLDVAIPVVARLGLANSGQACVSQSRLIVPRKLIPDVVDRLRAAFTQWPIGDPRNASTRLGPVATRAQFFRVNEMIGRASEQGAQLLIGGQSDLTEKDQGFYVKPTVFGGVTPEMQLGQEEVFGPVIAIQEYNSEADATALANSTHYGLSGAVWAKDSDRATAFARTMKTGQVVINGAAQNLATPFGGWGWSGFGRENGRFGIEDLLNYRSLHGA